MRCANSWQYVSWERKRVSHRSWLKGVPGREGVSGLDGSWSQQRALEGGHWSLSTEHVSGVRQDQPVCTIKVEAPSHETKRKANTSFTKVTGVAVSIHVSRILPKEVPSYQFCKSLPLSSKVYFSHCKSLTSPEMLCTVHVYFTITGSWGWGRRSTMSCMPHNIHMLKPRPPGLQIMTIFGGRAFKGVHAYMHALLVMSDSSRPHGL